MCALQLRGLKTEESVIIIIIIIRIIVFLDIIQRPAFFFI
jgi:hypothetical protein